MATVHKDQRKFQRRGDDGLPPSCEENIAKGAQAGVEAGLKAVFSDTDFCEKFWEHGHEIFMKKTATGVHLWFGKRFLQWSLTLIIAIGGALWAVLKVKL